MQTSLRLVLPDEEATRRLGRALASRLAGGDLVLLEGDLGAGKTFLVRAMARALGVADHVPVTSPTFTLVNELPGEPPIVHADLYRIGDVDEVAELGLTEAIADGALVLVEWGEQYQEALGAPTLIVRIALTGETSRTVELIGHGARGEAIVESVGSSEG